MSIVEVIFWGSIFLTLYVYLGYPVVIAVLACIKKDRHLLKQDYEPTISLIIAAHNEEKVIAKKIENSLELDYPKDKLEIIVFSDASTDRTDEIVKSYSDRGIKLFRIEGRKGKAYCKNIVAERAQGEILVFSDANSIYERNAIKKLVVHFADPKVGCVAGELRYRKDSGVEGENLYWRYEQFIKCLEGKLGNLTTVNGAIYAIPKHYYPFLSICAADDFGHTLSIKAKCLKVIHEPEALAWEETSENILFEVNRRIRIVSQASFCLFYNREFRALLNPLRYGLFSFQLWSHKVLRWLSGIFLILSFLTNFILIGKGDFYVFFFACQSIFYIFAIWGLLQEIIFKKKAPKIPHIAGYFVISCYAMLKGFTKGLLKKPITIWTPIR
jgi:cellulose synthase/poly-beta-1,6-N-acetylglucosamine synthase-like glycosyltransferase